VGEWVIRYGQRRLELCCEIRPLTHRNAQTMIRVTFPHARRADAQANLEAFTRRGLLRLAGAALSSSALDSISQAIQQQEGYYPGSLAYTNNNPGNLVYAGQAGASPGAGGFASFPSYQAGYTALQNQIQLDAVRGTDANGNPINTLSDLISSWAPPSQNDTATYIANVSAQTGFDPSAPLSSLGTSIATAGDELFGGVITDDSLSSFPWGWAIAAGVAALLALR
jgi:hypothetical protein